MIALISLSLMILGCASKPVIEYKTIEVEVERLVPIDERLTRPLPPPNTEPKLWLDVVVLLLEYEQRWASCEQRMEIIRQLPQD